MNKMPLFVSILAGCAVLPLPEDQDSTWQTLCDGCGGSTSTASPPAGAVFLVRITAGTPALVTAGDRWDGTDGEALGNVLAPVGDLDDDGLWDLSARASGPAILRTTDTPGVRFAELEAEPLPIGDVDGDGRVDLALEQYQASTASILPGAELAAGGSFVVGDGWPVTPELAFGGPGPDIDLDGLADTVWVQQDWPTSRGTRVHVVLGADVAGAVPLATALGWVVPRDEMTGGGSWDLGDVDGDGARDLAIGGHVGNDHTGPGRLTVYSGAALADGRAEELGAIRASDDGRTEYRLFDVVPLGDLDLDGRADFAVTWGGPSRAELARIVHGDEIGTGDLDQIGRPIPLAGQVTAIDGRDLDGDGWAELLVHDVYQGTGGVFTGADLAAGASEPTWRYEGATSAVLAGLDSEGRLVVWAADTPDW